jgi:hypothetical protein
MKRALYWTVGVLLFLGWADLVWGQTEKWSGESATLYTTLQGLSMIDAKQTFIMDEIVSEMEGIPFEEVGEHPLVKQLNESR